MRIVSSNSPEEIAAQRALDEVEQAIVELAANLMRVARGAGRPFNTLSQANDFLLAAQRYREAAGVWPSSYQLGEMLRLPNSAYDFDVDEAHNLMEMGKARMVSGALQLAASQLLDQKLQVAAGDREMFEGLRAYDEGREILRREVKPFSARKRAPLKKQGKTTSRGKRPK